MAKRPGESRLRNWAFVLSCAGFVGACFLRSFAYAIALFVVSLITLILAVPRDQD